MIKIKLKFHSKWSWLAIKIQITSSTTNLIKISSRFFRKQALQAKVEAEKEGIVVPLTLEEYCLKPKTNPNNQEPQVSCLECHDRHVTISSILPFSA